MVFIAMRYFNVDANIVALSGIAIAIGTMVDLGLVLSENIIKHLKDAPKTKSKRSKEDIRQVWDVLHNGVECDKDDLEELDLKLSFNPICGICCTNRKDCSLQCGHLFCVDCSRKLDLSPKRRCPLCRTTIKTLIKIVL